jgi:hypothetical protein
MWLVPKQHETAAQIVLQGETTNAALAKIVSAPVAVQLNSRLGNRRVNVSWGARIHCEAYIHLKS